MSSLWIQLSLPWPLQPVSRESRVSVHATESTTRSLTPFHCQRQTWLRQPEHFQISISYRKLKVWPFNWTYQSHSKGLSLLLKMVYLLVLIFCQSTMHKNMKSTFGSPPPPPKKNPTTTTTTTNKQTNKQTENYNAIKLQRKRSKPQFHGDNTEYQTNIQQKCWYKCHVLKYLLTASPGSLFRSCQISAPCQQTHVSLYFFYYCETRGQFNNEITGVPFLQ